MTKEEILAVTEQDTEACAKLNRLVHEKLGKCWHDWQWTHKAGIYYACSQCKAVIPETPIGSTPRRPENPDYCHSIADCWAIKDWLDKQDWDTAYRLNCALVWLAKESKEDLAWVSPLDRVKAFLAMGDLCLSIPTVPQLL